VHVSWHRALLTRIVARDRFIDVVCKQAIVSRRSLFPLAFLTCLFLASAVVFSVINADWIREALSFARELTPFVSEH
jgi:hypothetical protein